MRRVLRFPLLALAILSARPAWAQAAADPAPTPAPSWAPAPVPAPPPAAASAPVPSDAPPTAAPAAPREDKTAVGHPQGDNALNKKPFVPFSEGGSFEFGSYGRVRIASDLQGGVARPANIVAYGTRIDEESYAEAELRREDKWKGDIATRIVFTLALFPEFFHFTGKSVQAIGVRNLYAQARVKDQWTIWGGSRMYRGDDIYLLNWWPLDNQNTVGGGVGWNAADGDTTVATHVGMQRLDNPYQTQYIQSPVPFGVTSQPVLYLNRPRTIETLKVTRLFRNGLLFPDKKMGAKAILYGEAHQIAAGVARDELTNTDKPMPADWGFLVGGQVGFWTGERDTHVNLFVRHARGLAAYDPLATPGSFANDKTTQGSSETLFALSGNWEKDWFGCLLGTYVRFFRDGDPSQTTTQKYDEGAVVIRPQLYFGEHWGLAVEGSYQARRFGFIDPETNAPLFASMVRGGVMPYFSPAGRGSFKRPQFRLIYVASYRDSGAQALYSPDDAFHKRDVEHFLGLNVEWWFNSSSYP
jgi:maltoporin